MIRRRAPSGSARRGRGQQNLTSVLVLSVLDRVRGLATDGAGAPSGGDVTLRDRGCVLGVGREGRADLRGPFTQPEKPMTALLRCNIHAPLRAQSQGYERVSARSSLSGLPLVRRERPAI